MGNELFTEVSCPNCLHHIDIREHGRHITCPACSSLFILEGHLCPNCNHYHRQEQGFCAQCGTALTRVCQKCKTVNWAGDEFCAACGGALDIFHLLHLQTRQATSARLQQQQEESHKFKAQEREASAKRLAAMQETERKRLRELHRQREIKRKQDQQLYILAGGLLLALLLIAILFSII